MRKIMHILALLLGAALVALGVGYDMVRGRPRQASGRHRYARRTVHLAGVAPGTPAQQLPGGGDTVRFPRPTYQSGRPLYPDLGGPGDWPRTLYPEGRLW